LTAIKRVYSFLIRNGEIANYGGFFLHQQKERNMFKDVMLFTRQVVDAMREIVSLGGYVTQKLTDSIFMAILPKEIDPASLGRSTPDRPDDLNYISSLVADGWEAVLRKKAEKGSEEEGVSWIDSDNQSPEHCFTDDIPLIEEDHKYLSGSVALGLVVVSGPTDELKFSDQNRARVIGETMEGLQFLAREGKEFDVCFCYDIRLLEINARREGFCKDIPGKEACEKIWRDPALTKMGYPTGLGGLGQYVADLKVNKAAKWAYPILFTKYPLEHFAYAVDRQRVVMQYDNDGWGPEKINRVIAHETCHIFGAADEYSKTCDSDSYGRYKVANENCKKYTEKQRSCLMNRDALTMCFWTRGQVGWIPKVEKGMGTVVVDNDLTYTFVKDDRQRFWSLCWDRKEWRWEHINNPQDVNVDLAFGSYADLKDRPCTFVKCSDGKLWNVCKLENRWLWSNLEKPYGVTIEQAMGNLTYLDKRPCTFVKGSGGNLWNLWRYKSEWKWTNLKKPVGVKINKTMGSVVDKVGQVYNFVLGNDNNLWVNLWDRQKWSWHNLELPLNVTIVDSMGTVVYRGDRPYVFVKGSDGNIWNLYLYKGKWSWSNLKTPEDRAVVQSMGSVVADNKLLNVFVKADDYHLWRLHWEDKKWHWQDLGGLPNKDGISQSMGTVVVNGISPHVFVSGFDGRMWCRLWTRKDWLWEDLL